MKQLHPITKCDGCGYFVNEAVHCYRNQQFCETCCKHSLSTGELGTCVECGGYVNDGDSCCGVQWVSHEYLDEMGRALDGETIGRDWTAYWEYPGFIEISKRRVNVSLCATPNWTVNNTIAMAFNYDDGWETAMTDVLVQWTGNVDKDVALYKATIGSIWEQIWDVYGHLTEADRGEAVTVDWKLG